MNGFLVIACGSCPDKPLSFHPTCEEARAAAMKLARELTRNPGYMEAPWNWGHGLGGIEWFHILEFVNSRSIGIWATVEVVDDDESVADAPSLLTTT